MKEKDLLYLRQLQRKVKGLIRIGWSLTTIRESLLKCLPSDKVHAEEMLQESFLFASSIFKKMWQAESETAGAKKACELLEIAMLTVKMPDELLGTTEEAQDLLDRIDPSLAPHDSFWKDFSAIVRQAFPQDEFSSRDGNVLLKRQVHQFRYVISCQQAEWVRSYYKGNQKTDKTALVDYLASLSGHLITVGASARLHNKAHWNGHHMIYPDGQKKQANFKILLDFHTEFILDCFGNFLNELDAQKMSENGVVNGASFNYGEEDSLTNAQSHSRYDVLPPRKWDPLYRDEIIHHRGERFASPQNNSSEWGYKSSTGYYAQQGNSAKAMVDWEVKLFKNHFNQMKRKRVLSSLKIWRNIFQLKSENRILKRDDALRRR